MYDPVDILEAARTIRPLLPDFPEFTARTVWVIDQQLSAYLNQPEADERTTARPILDLLQSYPATQTWLVNFLFTEPNEKGSAYQPLPGRPSLQRAAKYICPIGNDYTWYQTSDDDIPVCPTHLVSLVPADS